MQKSGTTVYVIDPPNDDEPDEFDRDVDRVGNEAVLDINKRTEAVDLQLKDVVVGVKRFRTA